jgi:hypothetical protein
LAAAYIPLIHSPPFPPGLVLLYKKLYVPWQQEQDTLIASLFSHIFELKIYTTGSSFVQVQHNASSPMDICGSLVFAIHPA